jgi:homogentisate 1,2-dioxygenase
MVDTFHTLQVSRQALGIEDTAYYQSWVASP